MYPGGIGKSSLVRIGMFNTFGECQRAAFSTLKELNSEKKGDYECGFACEGDLEILRPGLQRMAQVGEMHVLKVCSGDEGKTKRT